MDDKLQSAVEGLIDAVDKQHFRSMQKEAFLCAAKCCDAKGSYSDMQQCVTQCQQKMSAAETVLGGELEAFQGRLQRCAVSCRDAVADKVGPNTSQTELQSLQTQVDNCTGKCVDDHIATLPAIKKRVDDTLAKMR